ncbi:hypothetical protein GCM10009663_72140 [Kitasatospora arboriphila]|uniref:Uncharacterized protein n=1 Tax=Kitasatospora arboriphila TaxID=258052 RepID=A0ABP4ERP7_9ACTN
MESGTSTIVTIRKGVPVSCIQVLVSGSLAARAPARPCTFRCDQTDGNRGSVPPQTAQNLRGTSRFLVNPPCGPAKFASPLTESLERGSTCGHSDEDSLAVAAVPGPDPAAAVGRGRMAERAPAPPPPDPKEPPPP